MDDLREADLMDSEHERGPLLVSGLIFIYLSKTRYFFERLTL